MQIAQQGERDLMQGKINQGLANSALYLKVFGHAVIGWRWLEQALGGWLRHRLAAVKPRPSASIAQARGDRAESPAPHRHQ